MKADIKKSDLEKWADFLINHSLEGSSPDDVVMLKGEHITWPLMSVVQDKIFSAGGIADINIIAPDNNRGQVWGASVTRHGTIDQIKKVPDWHRERYHAMTKYIEILGSENPSLFASLPEKNAAELQRVDMEFKKIRLSKKWLLTLYPTQAFANLEGMSLEEYTKIIVDASTTDPAMLEELEEPIYEVLKNSNSIKIITVSPDSGKKLELRMDVSGRNVIKCLGKRNFPDGEVFTSPNAGTVEGEIFVDLPVYYNGVTIEGIYLRFEEGKIKDYKANSAHDTLKGIIETDGGSKRLGEVAFGINPGLQKALKHPLFVEKVGGTLHIAIGDSYPECYIDTASTSSVEEEMERFYKEGLANRSAQHVDIVTDFRKNGSGIEVYLDEHRLFVQGNRWLIE